MARSFIISSSQDVTVIQHSLINALFATGGTIAAWVYATDIDAGGSRILDKGENQFDGWTVVWNSADQFNFRHTWTGSQPQWYTPVLTLTRGVWQFVAVTYDGSDVANAPYLWVNETKYTSSATPIGTLNDDSNRNLYIASRDGNARYITGSIAEVAMWNTILADAELVSLARGRNPFRMQNTNLRLYMPLWGVHDPEINLISNGLTGSLDNNPPQAIGPPVEPFNGRWLGTIPLIGEAIVTSEIDLHSKGHQVFASSWNPDIWRYRID